MKKVKVLILFFMFIFNIIILSGCNKSEAIEAPNENTTEYSKYKIGIIKNWGPDYVLSSKKDMKLYRYENIASLVLALKDKKVDIAAFEKVYGDYVLSKIDGLKMCKKEIAQDKLIAYVNSKDEKLCNEFNEFISEFMKTDEYKDYVRRIDDVQNGKVDIKDIKLVGTGEEIVVSFDDSAYPFTAINTQNNKPMGFDYELLCRFSNYYNYKLKVILTKYDSGLNMVITRRANMMMGGLSSCFAENVDINSIISTIPYFYTTMNVIYVDDYSKLKKSPDVNGLE